jgi:hypothetical protein
VYLSYLHLPHDVYTTVIKQSGKGMRARGQIETHIIFGFMNENHMCWHLISLMIGGEEKNVWHIPLYGVYMYCTYMNILRTIILTNIILQRT